MNLEQFTKIWSEAGFGFKCSPRLAEALCKAADGDHSAFDEPPQPMTPIRITDSSRPTQ